MGTEFLVQMRQSDECGSVRNDDIFDLNLGSGASITLHVLRMFPEPIWKWLLYFKTQIDHFFQTYLNYFNLSTPCLHLKVIHTETNIQLSAADLFGYV